MPRTRRKGALVAQEAIVVTVGARPIEYVQKSVLNRRTGEMQTIPMTDPGWPPVDEGDDGVAYVFRTGQRVHPGHPAYEDCKATTVFIPLEDAEEMDLVEA